MIELLPIEVLVTSREKHLPRHSSCQSRGTVPRLPLNSRGKFSRKTASVSQMRSTSPITTEDCPPLSEL